MSLSMCDHPHSGTVWRGASECTAAPPPVAARGPRGGRGRCCGAAPALGAARRTAASETEAPSQSSQPDDGRGRAQWEAKARPNEAQWEAQLAKLAAYKAAHGDCTVPRHGAGLRIHEG